ncbi:hypothetical protein [Alloscardovia criceti]|uniref:hypothetical protein n=1 Tax=Alloscardovia criceti TaxID=356828 RepID=UPI000378FD55|nr:hypothetical protein [Alloscardovia criceti]
MKNFTHNLSHDVLDAAQEAAENLESLWPLTDAQQLDNDVHFGDNLQVRQTFEIAKLILGLGTPEEQDLTIADAEYVFEGAEDIPGRDQTLVDALLAANDAYEQAHELQDDFSAVNVAQTAACVAAGGAISADIDNADDIIDTYLDAADDAEAEGDNEDDVENVARAFTLGYELATDIAQQSEDPISAASLMVLIANEYLDYVDTPRIFVSAEQLTAVYDAQVDDAALESLIATASQHWNYRHDEILWDKDEAKRQAKAEDERKSKAALAAKFAHIQDDPHKEEVEL